MILSPQLIFLVMSLRFSPLHYSFFGLNKFQTFHQSSLRFSLLVSHLGGTGLNFWGLILIQRKFQLFQFKLGIFLFAKTRLSYSQKDETGAYLSSWRNQLINYGVVWIRRISSTFVKRNWIRDLNFSSGSN